MFSHLIGWSFSLAASVLLMYPGRAFAQCVAGDDPCAPKKELGVWDKSLSFGFNLTRGNSDTVLVNVGGRAHKELDNNIWDFSMSYNYGEDEKVGGETGDDTTRNDLRAAGKYDRLVSERAFLGFGATYLYDEIADVDYRVTLDPNVGYYLVKESGYQFRLEGGPSYVFERQGGEDNSYFAPRLGERFEWVISCTSKFFESAEVLFDASDSENYLVNAEAGIEAAVAVNLALVFSVRETYDNVPAQGRDKSDLAVITALKVSL